MEKLIKAKACVWDVTTSYLEKGRNGNEHSMKIKVHQKMETKGMPQPTKIKTVELNGSVIIFELGKKNEYYSKNGQSLTGLMLATAATRGNKVRIY